MNIFKNLISKINITVSSASFTKKLIFVFSLLVLTGISGSVFGFRTSRNEETLVFVSAFNKEKFILLQALFIIFTYSSAYSGVFCLISFPSVFFFSFFSIYAIVLHNRFNETSDELMLVSLFAAALIIIISLSGISIVKSFGLLKEKLQSLTQKGKVYLIFRSICLVTSFLFMLLYIYKLYLFL